MLDHQVLYGNEDEIRLGLRKKAGQFWRAAAEW
jgi:hypothetical protein